MKGYLDAKELESYKKEDLQELAKQLGVDAEGTKKEIATRCAAVEVDIPDESELTLMALYQHRANIVRLIHGEENKIFSKKK